jgi:N-methylhydantoinase B
MPGTMNTKKVLKPSTAMTWMVSHEHPLRGVCGGEDACAYENWYLVGTPDEFEVTLAAHTQMPAGGVMAYQNGGGSGFGPAIKRDPQAVCEDVLDEMVSVKAARELYGVVLTGTLEEYDLAVDQTATAALRAKIANDMNAAEAAE